MVPDERAALCLLQAALPAAAERVCMSKGSCRPPITMQFNVPMFSASPLKVMYLRIQERNNYAVEKWVRKVCKAGNYHCRIK